MTAVDEIGPSVGITAACVALAVPKATYYRCKSPRPLSERARSVSPRGLTEGERLATLALLHEARFVDKAPAEVYATILDEGRYLCSTRTMYRILQGSNEVRERRDQLRHPQYAAPELLATQPNELWSWDITKLLGPVKWRYFQLYVVLDVFSRYVVGWLLAPNESAALAERLLEECCRRHAIEPGQLTIHADRGSSMRSKPVALLLSDLGVTKTHSRPHVSNDNPFSEAHFKTLKYRPQFPDRFGSIEDARAFCAVFFDWYNNQHRHHGIGLLTPADVHFGRAEQKRARRADVLAAAHVAHPERFVNGLPVPPPAPTAVWINEPKNGLVPDEVGCANLDRRNTVNVRRRRQGCPKGTAAGGTALTAPAGVGTPSASSEVLQ